MVPGLPDGLVIAATGWPATAAGATPGAVLTCDLDDADGAPGEIRSIVPVVAPSFLAFGPDGRHVYAASRWPAGGPDRGASRPRQGQIAAIAISADGCLEPLGSVETGGTSPCHLSVDQRGCHVLVADYAGGSVTVHPRRPDGTLGAPSDIVRRHGSGPDPVRQSGPHAHMVREVARTRRVLVSDLGTDELAVYALDHGAGTLSEQRHSTVHAAAGSGPRHFVIAASGTVLLATELRAGVEVFAPDPRSGDLERLGRFPSTGSSVPAAPSGLALSRDGRHLYVGNRGPNTIGVLRVTTAGLRLVGEVGCAGEPRDLTLAGDVLYVANQESDTLAVLRRNESTGLLEDAHRVARLPGPTCVLPFHRRDTYHRRDKGQPA